MSFKIDTGADVFPERMFRDIFKEKQPALGDVTRPLLGPGQVALEVVGVARLLLKLG